MAWFEDFMGDMMSDMRESFENSFENSFGNSFGGFDDYYDADDDYEDDYFDDYDYYRGSRGRRSRRRGYDPFEDTYQPVGGFSNRFRDRFDEGGGGGGDYGGGDYRRGGYGSREYGGRSSGGCCRICGECDDQGSSGRDYYGGGYGGQDFDYGDYGRDRFGGGRYGGRFGGGSAPDTGPNATPGWYVTNNSGARYGISDRELEILQSPTQNLGSRPLPRPIPMQRAAQQIEERSPIEHTAEYRNAWARVTQAIDQGLSWDVCVKMFNDLDTILFNGDLRYRVYIQALEMTQANGGGLQGFTSNSSNWNNEKLRICMSSDENWQSLGMEHFLSVMIHEMLHAYFNVWCRNNTYEGSWERGRDAQHGHIYMAAGRALMRKLGLRNHCFDYR